MHPGSRPCHLGLWFHVGAINFHRRKIETSACDETNLYDMVSLAGGGARRFKINRDELGFAHRLARMKRSELHLGKLPPYRPSRKRGWQIFDSMADSAKPSAFTMSPPARLALFGGTFDPVHDGHLAIASEAKRAAGLDQILFLPARQSPHKSGRRLHATDDQRLEMLRLATREMDWAEVSDWEIRQPPPSYSWRTALHFRAIYPECSLYWILGADQWAVIEEWAEPESLRSTLEFIVFPRPPLPTPLPRPGWRARFLNTVHPASATDIRAELSRGVSAPVHLPTALLPLAHHIYGPRSSCDNPSSLGDAL